MSSNSLNCNIYQNCSISHRVQLWLILNSSIYHRTQVLKELIKSSISIKLCQILISDDFMIHLQIDWTNLFVTCCVIFFPLFTPSKKNYDHFLRFIAFKWIWGVSSAIFILLMISGYMFTKMRQVPLAGADRNGDIIYFAANEFQNQFDVETQIVAFFLRRHWVF